MGIIMSFLNDRLTSNKKKSVLITGFGPFSGCKVNPSWQAVKNLPSNFAHYKLHKNEIPVAYSDVSHKIPMLIKDIDPVFIIHVGQGKEGMIKLETDAWNSGYVSKDIHGHVPPNGKCCDSDMDGMSIEPNLKNL
jgi:pyroglutamyl-peptidase